MTPVIEGGRGPRRRIHLRCGSIALATCLIAACGANSSPVRGPTASRAADEAPSRFLGNVWSNAQLPGFLDHWDQVTPENAGKWGSMEPTRDTYNWTGLDQAYALARDNDLPFRFHVLVWGNQQPAWMEDLPAAEQLEE